MMLLRLSLAALAINTAQAVTAQAMSINEVPSQTSDEDQLEEEMDKLRAEAQSQYYTNQDLEHKPDSVAPALEELLKEKPKRKPMDDVEHACEKDAKRLCGKSGSKGKGKSTLHCLGLAQMKYKQDVSKECREKVSTAVPYACSIEIFMHGCDGIEMPMMQCIEEKADEIGAECKDSIQLAKKFLDLVKSKKEALSAHNRNGLPAEQYRLRDPIGATAKPLVEGQSGPSFGTISLVFLICGILAWGASSSSASKRIGAKVSYPETRSQTFELLPETQSRCTEVISKTPLVQALDPEHDDLL